MTDKELLTDYHINPDEKGELAFEIDNVLFFKNNEFDGKIIKGYSLPGLWIQPKFIKEALDVIIENKTAFIVAHRLSTIRNSDRILYIADKGIKEQGTHAELMKLKGYYYDLNV